MKNVLRSIIVGVVTLFFLFGGVFNAQAESLEDEIQRLMALIAQLQEELNDPVEDEEQRMLDLIAQLQEQIAREQEIQRLMGLISQLQDQIANDNGVFDLYCYSLALPGGTYRAPGGFYETKFNRHDSLISGDTLSSAPEDSYVFNLSFSSSVEPACEYDYFILETSQSSENGTGIQIWADNGQGEFVDIYNSPGSGVVVDYQNGVVDYPEISTHVVVDEPGEYTVVFMLWGVRMNEGEEERNILQFGAKGFEVLDKEKEQPYFFRTVRPNNNFKVGQFMTVDGVRDGTQYTDTSASVKKQLEKLESFTLDTVRDKSLLPSSQNYYTNFEYRLKVLRGDRNDLQIWSKDVGSIADPLYNIAAGEDPNWGRAGGVGRPIFGEHYIYSGNNSAFRLGAYVIPKKAGTYEIQFELYGYRDGVITPTPIATSEIIKISASNPSRRTGSFAPGYGPNATPRATVGSPTTEAPISLEPVLETESSSIGILGWIARLFGFFASR